MSNLDLEKNLDEPSVSKGFGDTPETAGGEEREGSSGKSQQPESFLKRLLSEFNLFDALLLVSFLLITLSTLYLMYAMSNSYGGWPWDKPWDIKL